MCRCMSEIEGAARRSVESSRRCTTPSRPIPPRNWLFDQELASGEVQHLLPDWEAAAIPIHLVSPRERRHSAKVLAFAEYVAKATARG
jgi:DNA-binding transcriptional LysR family regulator